MIPSVPASCILQLVKYIQKLQQKDVEIAEEVIALFAGELNPVAPKAQKKVPVPEGLDLDAWINEPPSESESEDEQPRAIFSKEEPKYSRPRHTEVDEKELAKVGWSMMGTFLKTITKLRFM
ncbi:AP-3 complex subunit delta-1-like, partial [Notothenia coriiceps]|uniref:AP-3 complex subunit delta-1-like n=1 Tax=Notothenia coriiceps TaxID=8208 RepID=A0A6I9Q765_9TELE